MDDLREEQHELEELERDVEDERREQDAAFSEGRSAWESLWEAVFDER